MTFGSKHGRRTSTEDLYREVLQRWQKCMTTLSLMYFCGALLLSDSVSTMAPNQDAKVLPAVRDSSRDFEHRQTLLKVPIPKQLPLNLLDLMSSVQQVSASAKDCQKEAVQNASGSHVKSVVAEDDGNLTIKPEPVTYSPSSPSPSSSSSSAALNASSRHLACPHVIPYSGNRNLHQCLYLDELSVEEACRPSKRNHVHLRFCAQYSLGHLLPEGDVCGPSFLAQVRELDEAAKLLVCQFENLLQLYDCDTSFSVSWTCKDCKTAYRQWVCAMVLPFHLNGQMLKPCRSVCRLVEQICPYFHPSVKEQYAGERVFKCIDPDIPDLESISLHSVFGRRGHCHCPHHLESSTERMFPDDEDCKLSQSALRRLETTSASTPATNFSSEVSGNASVTGTAANTTITNATTTTLVASDETTYSGSPSSGTSSPTH